MLVKKFIIIALLGISCFLNANTHPAYALIASSSGDCEAPAPTNFQVVNLGPTWVEFSWIALTPLQTYRIKTFEVSSGLLVSNVLIAPGDPAIINGLVEDVEYFSRINVVCENGFDSPIFEEVSFRTLILDLIAIGFEGGNTPVQRIISTSGDTARFLVNGAVTTFRIYSTNWGFSRKFDISKLTATNRFLNTVKDLNTGQFYKIKADNLDPNYQTPVSGYELRIFMGSFLVAKLHYSLESESQRGVLTASFLAVGYKIERLGTTFIEDKPSPPKGPIRMRNTNAENHLNPVDIKISPNPFTETLEVFLAQTTTEQLSLQLFNLSGQKVLEQQFQPGAQQQFRLSTSGLSAGFYLLRVEADGRAQTLKVVKSE